MIGRRTWRMLLLAVLLCGQLTSIFCCASTVAGSPLRAGGPQEPSVPDKKSQLDAVRAILNARDIWGKDFKTALATVPHFGDTGEQAVLIFANKVVGTSKIVAGSSEARKALREINRKIEEDEATDAVRRDLKVEAFRFPEDNAQHITLMSATSEYLAPQTRISLVQERLGKPERISKHNIQNPNQDRPEILTFFHYAQDAIIFVSSNIKNYGYVDRVILNAPVIKAAMQNQ